MILEERGCAGAERGKLETMNSRRLEGGALLIENFGNIRNQYGVGLCCLQMRLRETERAIVLLFMLLLFGRIAGQGDGLDAVIRANLDFDGRLA